MTETTCVPSRVWWHAVLASRVSGTMMLDCCAVRSRHPAPLRAHATFTLPLGDDDAWLAAAGDPAAHVLAAVAGHPLIPAAAAERILTADRLESSRALACNEMLPAELLERLRISTRHGGVMIALASNRTWAGVYASTPVSYRCTDGHVPSPSAVLWQIVAPLFDDITDAARRTAGYGSQVRELATLDLLCNPSIPVASLDAWVEAVQDHGHVHASATTPALLRAVGARQGLAPLSVETIASRYQAAVAEQQCLSEATLRRWTEDEPYGGNVGKNPSLPADLVAVKLDMGHLTVLENPSLDDERLRELLAGDPTEDHRWASFAARNPSASVELLSELAATTPAAASALQRRGLWAGFQHLDMSKPPASTVPLEPHWYTLCDGPDLTWPQVETMCALMLSGSYRLGELVELACQIG